MTRFRTVVVGRRVPVLTRRNFLLACVWGIGVPFVGATITWGTINGGRYELLGIGLVFFGLPLNSLACIVWTVRLAVRLSSRTVSRHAVLFAFVSGAGWIVATLLMGARFSSRHCIKYALILMATDLSLSLAAIAIVRIWQSISDRPCAIQDGTLCFGCGYSLIGNASMTCPECGRAYSLEELDQTPESWAQLAKESGGGHAG